jgi:hypothetical protein
MNFLRIPGPAPFFGEIFLHYLQTPCCSLNATGVLGCESGFSDFVDPDLYWESGARGKKINKFQWKNALFSYFSKKNFTTKRHKIALLLFEKKI